MEDVTFHFSRYMICQNLNISRTGNLKNSGLNQCCKDEANGSRTMWSVPLQTCSESMKNTSFKYTGLQRVEIRFPQCLDNKCFAPVVLPDCCFITRQKYLYSFNNIQHGLNQQVMLTGTVVSPKCLAGGSHQEWCRIEDS